MNTPGVRMRWDDLLFLHWPVPQAVMRPLVPPSLTLDLFDETAWIALVPFRMEQTRFRGIPDLPGLGSFYECNVRTDVRTKDAKARDVPGVWFFSLDAERLLPVLGGRWLWSLNYIHSRFAVHAHQQRFEYTLTRQRNPEQRTRIEWSAGDPIPPSIPGSLEHFLTERYWLFTLRGGRILGGRVEHKPWSLRSATLHTLDDTLMQSARVPVSGQPLAWHSDSISVLGYPLQRMDQVQTTEQLP